jgi:dTDP-4-dehydrorhamnose 3,5-epimerase-like enzyme
MQYKKLTFLVRGDDRGNLISLEENKNIPFDIKRVYYIFDNKEGFRRGFHAHKNLEQVLVCVNGSCEILLDDGKEKSIIKLENRNEGLFIEKLVWREMFNFSADCVLMVLASDYYYEEDYIRDYQKFLNLIKKN